MILEKSMHDGWLSNTWLVGDRPGGHAVVIDTGAPPERILKAIEEHDLTLTHVLCTHHHIDHIENNGLYRGRFGCPICGHANEESLFGGLQQRMADGDEIRSGDLHVRALHIPGHTSGQLAFLVDEADLFTGDTLFKGSVGGTRGPDHTTFDDLQHSVMDRLMTLPKETRIHPGHMDSSTIGQEWENNPFVRAWRGVDAPANTPCLAFGQPAVLLLEARDYDGGTKAWVRFQDTDTLDLVPGSQLEKLPD